jgi:hypothetical protein
MAGGPPARRTRSRFAACCLNDGTRFVKDQKRFTIIERFVPLPFHHLFSADVCSA